MGMGNPTSGPNAAYSGENHATNLSGNYENIMMPIESPTISLPDDKNQF